MLKPNQTGWYLATFKVFHCITSTGHITILVVETMSLHSAFTSLESLRQLNKSSARFRKRTFTDTGTSSIPVQL